MEQNKNCSSQDKNRIFKELTGKIINLERKFLEHTNEIFVRATQEIDQNFKLAEYAEVEPLITSATLCRALIWNRLFDDEWQYIYFIPAKFLKGSTVSGIVCAFGEFLTEQEHIVLTQIVNRIFSLFQFGLYLQQMNLFALRSATAAIMARNKSHIHGSHIEHGLRNKMDTYEDVVKERLASDSTFYKLLVEKLTLHRLTSFEEVADS